MSTDENIKNFSSKTGQWFAADSLPSCKEGCGILFSPCKEWYRLGKKGVWSKGGMLSWLGIKVPLYYDAKEYWGEGCERVIVSFVLKKASNHECFLRTNNRVLACKNGENEIFLSEMVGERSVRYISIDCKGGRRPSDEGYADDRYLGVHFRGVSIRYDSSLPRVPYDKATSLSYLSGVAFALENGLALSDVHDVENHLVRLVDMYFFAPFKRQLEMEREFSLAAKLVSYIGINNSLKSKVLRCKVDLIKKQSVKLTPSSFLQSSDKDTLFEVPLEFSMPSHLASVDDNIKADIVQYWEGGSTPEEMIFFKRKLERLGFKHDIFDREMARDFILKEYSRDVLNLFDMAWHPAMESDIFRVLYCAINPSVYLDADWQLKGSGSLNFPLDYADAWFRLLGRKRGPSHLHGPYVCNDMLFFRSGELGVKLADLLVKDLWRYRNGKGPMDLHALTGPGFFARSLKRLGLAFASTNLLRRVKVGGAASPIYKTSYGDLGFVGPPNFQGLRAAGNMRLSKQWIDRGVSSDWRKNSS